MSVGEGGAYSFYHDLEKIIFSVHRGFYQGPIPPFIIKTRRDPNYCQLSCYNRTQVGRRPMRLGCKLILAKYIFFYALEVYMHTPDNS